MQVVPFNESLTIEDILDNLNNPNIQWHFYSTFLNQNITLEKIANIIDNENDIYHERLFLLYKNYNHVMSERFKINTVINFLLSRERNNIFKIKCRKTLLLTKILKHLTFNK